MSRSFPIYYETLGSPKDPCILFISGLGAQLIQWPKALIERLVNKGFYVVIFDNRDSGLSKRYDHLGKPSLSAMLYAKLRAKIPKKFYTLEDMAADVILLMDHLSISKANILGISMGGMIAQLLALKYSERLLKLILMGTTSGDYHLPPAKPEVRKFFALSSYYKKENKQNSIHNKTKLFQIYNPCFHNDEKTHRLLTTVYERSYNPDGLKRQLIATFATKPRGEQLKQIRAKTLIIHGAIDPLFPLEHATYMASCFLHAQLEIIKNMGHIIPEELCEQISQIIADFLYST